MAPQLDPEAAAIANDIQLAQQVPTVDGGDLAVDTAKIDVVSISHGGVNPLIEAGTFVANYNAGTETIVTLRT